MLRPEGFGDIVRKFGIRNKALFLPTLLLKKIGMVFVSIVIIRIITKEGEMTIGIKNNEKTISKSRFINIQYVLS